MNIDEIKESYRRRTHVHGAEKRLTLQIKAICRRHAGLEEDGTSNLREAERIYKAVMENKLGEHPAAAEISVSVFPLVEARRVLEGSRKKFEKEIKLLAKDLAVSEWIKDVRGVSDLLLGQIIGEAGDLSNYPNHRHLWKRMGLAVIEGQRQRRVKGEEALEHGYAPRRRALMWVVGDCIIKAGKGHYREVYDLRKDYEIKQANEAGLKVVPAAKIPKSDPESYRSEGHVHLRAKRYMEKIFLRDLWLVWNEMAGTPKGQDSAPNTSLTAA